MITREALQMLAESDGNKLSDTADDMIRAINKNHGFCLRHKGNVHELKKHEHEEMQCPCYEYRKTGKCKMGLFI